MVPWKTWGIVFLLAVFNLWAPLKTFSAEDAVFTTAEDKPFSDFSTIENELLDGFNYLLKTLLSGSVIDPTDSTQNPRNDFLRIPSYSLKCEFRPDFSLSFRDIKLSIKPRYIGIWEDWEFGTQKGQEKTDDEIFVNEWLASYRFHDDLFLSYGRENLQWGPSFMLSPSNPFFRDNGQANPKQEVRGMDFVRSVWVMNPTWTVSFIDNVGKGEQRYFYEFEPTYAVKVDYTAFRKYGSMIGSYTENDRFHLGGFAGWTVSDGLMLYTEDTFSLGSDALYPISIYFQPLDVRLIQMAPVKANSSSLESLLLFGGSYTFESGQTVTAEYAYNSAGYSRKEAELYYRYRRVASRFYDFPYPIGDLSRLALVQTLDTKLKLLRQDYLLLQYQQTQIRQKLNLLVRSTINLNDGSVQIIPYLGYDLGDHAQLYLIGNQNIGGTETEFGSFYEYGITLGIEYIF